MFTVGCEPGSEYGKLEVGSSSDQHATDEESSILSDGVAVVGVRVFRVGTMAPLRIKLNKLLSEYQKAEWSKSFLLLLYVILVRWALSNLMIDCVLIF